MSGSSSSSASSAASLKPDDSLVSPPVSPSAKPLISEIVKAGEAERRRHARLEPDVPTGTLRTLVLRVNLALVKALVNETKTGGRIDSLTINTRMSANTLMLTKSILLPAFTQDELASVFVLKSTNALTKLANGSLVVGGRGGVILEWSIGEYISYLIADYFTSVDRDLAHHIVDSQSKSKITAAELAWH